MLSVESPGYVQSFVAGEEQASDVLCSLTWAVAVLSAVVRVWVVSAV